jgi:DNA-binding NarL/FixJ family response regulator
MQRGPAIETDRPEVGGNSDGETGGGLAALSPTIIEMDDDRRRRSDKRVLIIDERSFRRECVVRLLREISPEYAFSALARTHDLAAEQPCPQELDRVDVLILNIGAIRLPDERVSADIRYLNGCFAEAPIILLSDREDSAQVAEALRYGVRGFIPTTLGAKVVAEAVRLVGAGGTFIPASALVHALAGARQQAGEAGGRARRAEAAGLTPRELDVLNLLREGKPNKIIAAELDLKETTVKIHVRHLMKKMKATNRTEAALMAERAL